MIRNFLLDTFWFIIGKLVVFVGTLAYWFFEHKHNWWHIDYGLAVCIITVVGLAYLVYNFPRA